MKQNIMKTTMIRISESPKLYLEKIADELGVPIRALVDKIIWEFQGKYPGIDEWWEFWRNGR